MTRVVLLSATDDLRSLQAQLREQAPDLEVFMQGEPGATEAEVAACWRPPVGSLGALENLRLVHSVAAGIDNLLHDPSLPLHVPVCRIVDPDHRQGMAEYVLWGVLHFHRHFDEVLARQPSGRWQTPPQRTALECRVGVLGLGALGAHAAGLLAQLGFSVRGWARSAKDIASVETYAGPEQLPAFLDGLHILVCLLPLTAETRGLLDAQAFARLAPGAGLINCGRGEHVVRADLLDALDSGQLRGAVLDVFEEEPLPADDPLWRHPRLSLTPHMASVASEASVARQLIANIRRLEQGEPLLNSADPRNGY